MLTRRDLIKALAVAVAASAAPNVHGAQYDPMPRVVQWLQANGFRVLDVRGTTIRVATREHPEGEWVDVVENQK